jgi:hypothetical protein
MTPRKHATRSGLTPRELAKRIAAREAGEQPAKKRVSLGRALMLRVEQQALDARVRVEVAGRRVRRIHCLNFAVFSLNPFFGRVDYRRRHEINGLYAGPVRRALEDAAATFAPYTVPVGINVTVFGRGQLVDPDNALLKPIVDACRQRVFVDDSSRYIAQYSVRVLRSETREPLLIIEFEERA